MKPNLKRFGKSPKINYNMVFILYILPAILTFLLIRKIVKSDKYESWTNQTMLLAILLSLMPILNWLGTAVYLFVGFLELIFYIVDKLSTTEPGKKFRRWLEQDSF